ncbi:DUF6297 family protein [Micromonospora endolithica]|uniref:Uncharacterized protein n=1 Tax=Micromonospora endolithica TaxID=230091 RepID=A0A3A9ZUB6_9ACTN|nr:DUF6297 family protein [Micromonospora endolithica]RKN51037.1 hypothetical protein D7223_04735 [Micromonospora endolithica]TWJ20165.1 hypothetical protein JD76_00260 [Micromonospora endolithica]
MSQLRESPVAVAGPPPRARELRRWVRRRRAAAGASLSLETVYVLALTVVITVAMVGPSWGRLLWPDRPAPESARWTVVALLAAAAVGLLLLLRRLGPLLLRRDDLAWLLPTPVPRRGLLLPALARVLVGAAAAGALVALGGVAQLAERPTPPSTFGWWVATGAAGGVLLALLAVAAQRRPGRARPLDVIPVVALPPLGALALVEPAGAVPGVPVVALGPLASAVLAAAAVATAVTVRALASFPGAPLHDPSRLLGSHLDAAYAAEPSFLPDLWERRYWRGRALRSRPLRRGRLPGPVRHDLLILARKRRRLGWLALAAAVPAVLVQAPGGTLALLVVLGGSLAAGTTLDATRRDAAAPALLRLLGLTGRRVLVARTVAPALLASVWCALAAAVLAATGDLPPGPWWALGLALGPTVAVMALRRARSGLVDNSLPLVDTPAGSFAPGPLIWLLAGVDQLMFAVPALAALGGLLAPTWAWVLVQVGLSAAGLAAWLLLGTDRRRPVL